jgi:hypothetical protein
MPSCHAVLCIAGHHVTSNHKQRIPKASLLPTLRWYIKECNSWTNRTRDLID